MRRSCNLLSRDEMKQSKTPTTPTISSIIAGVQCQEAVKLLHGMEDLAAIEFLSDKLKDTKTNEEFFKSMKRK